MDDIGHYKKGKSGRDRYETVALDPVFKLQFVELSYVWGHGAPIAPGDPEIRIERGVTHAHDGVFSQKITMTMHNSTHMNAPIFIWFRVAPTLPACLSTDFLVTASCSAFQKAAGNW